MHGMDTAALRVGLVLKLHSLIDNSKFLALGWDEWLELSQGAGVHLCQVCGSACRAGSGCSSESRCGWLTGDFLLCHVVTVAAAAVGGYAFAVWFEGGGLSGM
jgi:nitrate reductase NapE component